jgi:RNA-binding protein
MNINASHIKKLKSLSHHLKPSVNIGKDGLSEGVIQSISEILERHELIKIKFHKNKDSKEIISKDIVTSTKSTKVSIIGNTLIIYKQSSNLKYRQIKL